MYGFGFFTVFELMGSKIGLKVLKMNKKTWNKTNAFGGNSHF